MEVASGVYRLGTRLVSFYIIEEGDRLTLIDAGLPGYWNHLIEFFTSSRLSLSDIEAVVLTHAHVDHIGFSERLRSEQGVAVQVHAEDVDLATGRQKAAVSRAPVWRLMLLRYLLHGVANGAARFPSVVEASTFGDGEILDLPGRPRVIHAPGHTKGSCALQSSKVLFAGDVLATIDITTGQPGPRIGPSFVNDDSEQALRSLDRLAGLDADTVLVGHGEPWREGIDEAVRRAREIGIW